MSKPRLIHVPEPQLEFRFGQKVDYPRDGLYLFGPVDAAHEPRQVRYGVIGTPASLRRFKEWAAQVSSFIDVPPPRRMSKAIEAHHVAFPGFSEAIAAPQDVRHRRDRARCRHKQARDDPAECLVRHDQQDYG